MITANKALELSNKVELTDSIKNQLNILVKTRAPMGLTFASYPCSTKLAELIVNFLSELGYIAYYDASVSQVKFRWDK